MCNPGMGRLWLHADGQGSLAFPHTTTVDCRGSAVFTSSFDYKIVMVTGAESKREMPVPRLCDGKLSVKQKCRCRGFVTANSRH